MKTLSILGSLLLLLTLGCTQYDQEGHDKAVQQGQDRLPTRLRIISSGMKYIGTRPYTNNHYGETNGRHWIVKEISAKIYNPTRISCVVGMNMYMDNTQAEAPQTIDDCDGASNDTIPGCVDCNPSMTNVKFHQHEDTTIFSGRYKILCDIYGQDMFPYYNVYCWASK